VRPGELVAVLAPCSPAWIAGLLGVWRVGAAYLPLDPAHPKARIDALLRDAAPVAVLTDEWLTSVDAPSTWVEPVDLPDDAPAYLLHTSGTSGTPKGVLTARRGVRNYLAWGVRNYSNLSGTSLLHSPVATDTTLLTVFGTLLAGGRLRIASLDDAPTERVADFVDLTPSHLRLGSALPTGFVPTGELVLGGEGLSGELLAPWLADHPGLTVTNEYGPTEIVVGCVAHRVVEVAPGPVPIGRPIWNTRVYVLDARMNPVPPGETGELYVAGDGVALGYLGQPAITASRFVADPFGPAGSRMYRTGDLARWSADGLLYCLGRADDQLSVHGFRVEPGEIEAALRALPGVQAAAVAIVNNQLVGCVVGEAQLELLRERLPGYSVPARVFSVEALPLTANGKLDIVRLPVVDVAPSAGPAEGPVGAICALFAEVLCLPEVGPDDSLFRLGGDSMTAIQLVSRGRDSGLIFTAKDVFQLRTPARLAEAATAAPSAGEQASDAIGLVPPTPIMRWARDRGGSIDRLNQSVVFRTPADARWDQIVDVLQAVLDRHDMLRADLDPATWQLRVPPVGTVQAEPLVHWVDAEPLDDDQLATQIATQRADAVGRLNPSAGAMLRAAWFDAGSRPGRLLLVVHHLVIDGMSWGILATDLNAAWQQQPLSRRGTAFRTWANALDPADAPIVESTEAPLGSRVADPARDTADTGLRWHSTMPIVSTEVAEAYRADVQDILLAGLVRAIGRTELLVDVESHGRDVDVLPGADLGRTVGWFTALRPVRLDGAVRPISEAQRAEAVPQVGFNYLGRAFTGGTGDWSIVAETDWAADAADGPFTRTLEIDLRVVDDRISVLWQWPAALLSEADVRRIAGSWLHALDMIRADAPRAGRLTTADLGLVSLSQDEIDELEGGWSA
jgi:pristinamycin I synthase-2